jgi:hypothetical protein
MGKKDFVLMKLVPERRNGDMVIGSPGCCSCCCCCCLHSAGSLVGAMLGSRIKMDGDSDEPEVTSKQAMRKAYWALLLVSSVLAAIISMLTQSGDPVTGLVILLMLLPAVQVVVSVLTLPVLLLNKVEGAGNAPYKQLGKITLYSVAGGAIGGIVMAAIPYLDLWISRN